jgi:hypothetical protein
VRIQKYQFGPTRQDLGRNVTPRSTSSGLAGHDSIQKLLTRTSNNTLPPGAPCEHQSLVRAARANSGSGHQRATLAQAATEGRKGTHSESLLPLRKAHPPLSLRRELPHLTEALQGHPMRVARRSSSYRPGVTNRSGLASQHAELVPPKSDVPSVAVSRGKTISKRQRLRDRLTIRT